MNGYGIGWGAKDDQLRHARETVVAARLEHLKQIKKIDINLNNFIEATQTIARITPYSTPFAGSFIKSKNINFFLDFYGLFLVSKSVIQDAGFLSFMKIIFKRIVSGRFKI